MRIYIDIDDVLCETAASLCRLASQVFGRDVAYEDVREFDLQRVFGLTDAEMARFAVLSHAPEWLLNFPETSGAVAGVKALRDAGADIDILTGRPASSHVETEAWLSSVGLGDFNVEYVDKYARSFTRKPGDPPTVPLADLLRRRYDYAIDDSPVILRSLAAWRETKVLVFDRPWNRAFTLAGNMIRVDGWKGVREAFGSLLSGPDGKSSHTAFNVL